MSETFMDCCLRKKEIALLGQWDYEANLPLTPATVTSGSSRRVWWKCELGHRWQTYVYTRANGSGCPVCGGRQILAGFNDLASRFPELASQWHPTKNGDLTPDQVLAGGHKRVWWQCEKGHEWSAEVRIRVRGCGCPVCSGRTLQAGENDLASRFPNLAAQWHPDKNDALTLMQVLPGSHRKVWWQCEKGHEWQAAVSSRVTGNGCPICSGKKIMPGENDLATRFPELSSQWDRAKNGDLLPSQLAPTSNRKVWWRCEFGHSYCALVSTRTMRQTGCPYCDGKQVLPGFNDLASRFPEIADQWDHDLNGTLTPEQVTAGSRRKVWWRCSLGHSWKAVIYSRTGAQKCNCPVCAGVCKVKTLSTETRAIPTTLH